MMSKNRNRSDGNNNNQKERRIPKDVKEFIKFVNTEDKENWENFKKYNKKQAKKDDWGDYELYDSNKEWKEAFYNYLLDRFPAVIKWIIRDGYLNNPEIVEAKEKCLMNINDPKFVKLVKKTLKDDEKIENIKLFPVIAKEIIEAAEKTNAQRLAKDPNANTIDESDLADLCLDILKKKIKKFKKANVDAALAFDVLCVIPNDEIMSQGTFYKVRTLYNVLYKHASDKAVPFETIIDKTVKEERYPQFIAVALLETKEKFAKLNESQKKLYIDISNWCFSTLEELPKEEIEAIVKSYVNNRRRDDGKGKDSARRYALLSLSESEYPKVVKVVNKFKADNTELEKYLW